MRLCRKYAEESCCFLVIDTAVLFDPLCFRKMLIEEIQKVIMAIDGRVSHEKIQYHFSREVAKTFALSSTLGKAFQNQ